LVLAFLPVFAGEEANPPVKKPDFPAAQPAEKTRVPAKEREAKLKDRRDKTEVKNAREAERIREELAKLPPAEREARLTELKQKNPDVAAILIKKREESRKLTPQEREARMKEWRGKMEAVLEQLRRKKANGTLTAEEAKRLQRMEETSKRIDEAHQHKVSSPSPPQ
jgi:hypothetical protein